MVAWDPNQREREVWRGVKSQEQIEAYQKFGLEFDSKYRRELEKLFWDKDFLSMVAWKYELQDWSLEIAISKSVDELNLSPEEQRELLSLIIEYINTFNYEKIKDSDESKKESFSMDDIQEAIDTWELKDEKLISWAKDRLLNEETFRDVDFDYQDLWYIELLNKFLSKFDTEKTDISMFEDENFPIIERLVKSWKIKRSSYDQVLESYSKSWILSYEGVSDSQDRDIIEDSINAISWKDKSKNREDFFSDFPSAKREVDSWDMDTNDEILTKLIANNYVKIETDNKEQDKKENYSVAVRTIANKIISKSSNLKKDSEAYKKAIKDINSKDNKVQFLWLKSLYLLSWSFEWRFHERDIDQNELFNWIENTNERINRVRELILKSREKGEEALKRQLELIKESQLLERNSWIAYWWEVFASWDLDVVSQARESS